MSDRCATLRKRKTGGHYVRLMGTLWRHLKSEQAGDAALGMWMRMLSYCADVGRSTLTKREMAVLMAHDKNGPRKLAALLAAKLVDQVGNEYAPHDFYDHNPGIKPDGDSERDLDGEANVSASRGDGEGNVTRNVTRNVSKPPENNQALSPPSSRPRTQEVRTEQSSVGERVTAQPLSAGRTVGVSESGMMPVVDVMGLQLALGQAAHELGWDAAPEVMASQMAKAAKRVPGLAKSRGLSRDEAALLLCRMALQRSRATGQGVGFALCELDTTQPVQTPRRGGGRPTMAAATTHEDFADAEPMEVQLARLREA